MKYQVIKRIALGSRHARTGRTAHFHGAVQLPAPATLEIVSLAGEAGVYLIHRDASGVEMTDTLHDSVEDAEAQAEWEFGVQPGDWLPN